DADATLLGPLREVRPRSCGRLFPPPLELLFHGQILGVLRDLLGSTDSHDHEVGTEFCEANCCVVDRDVRLRRKKYTRMRGTSLELADELGNERRLSSSRWSLDERKVG